MRNESLSLLIRLIVIGNDVKETAMKVFRDVFVPHRLQCTYFKLGIFTLIPVSLFPPSLLQPDCMKERKLYHYLSLANLLCKTDAVTAISIYLDSGPCAFDASFYILARLKYLYSLFLTGEKQKLPELVYYD